MTEYLARKEYTYSGGDAKFTIPFPYIDKTYIKVYVNGTATSGWTLLNESQLQVISPVLANGDSVVVARQTPITDKLVTFTDTSILNEDVQNLAQDQLFHAIQEMYDLVDNVHSKNSFIFEQNVASDTWEIQHNLGRFPSITIVDSSGSVIIPERKYINENKCIAKMLAATTGTAYLN